uniref:Uncharacterized protein LOC116945140 isoform X1 n=1 Tax=Petromyzon marinus TaxID=7757 RepID=A0AAJ7X079_PETMA|nr:uncharacterized protein LOC116945140 isoform X1 [Petromyzon marinus]
MERARGRNRILISCPGSQLGKIVTVQDGPLGGESADAWASLLGPGRHAACKHSPQLIAALSRVLAGKPPTAVLQAQPPVRGREYSSRRPRDAVTAKSKQPRLGHGEKISGWCDKVDLGALSMQTGPEQALEAVPSGADDGVPVARRREWESKPVAWDGPVIYLPSTAPQQHRNLGATGTWQPGDTDGRDEEGQRDEQWDASEEEQQQQEGEWKEVVEVTHD